MKETESSGIRTVREAAGGPDPEELKRLAGAAAADAVVSGMRLGLGTGSTVAHFLVALGQRVAAGAVADLMGVPTSERTERAARELGIPLGSLTEMGELDLAVDGADEVGPSLDLIKGLGGALLREKMVAQASRRFLVIADERKRVSRLGTLAPLPVEVVPFEHEGHMTWLSRLGCEPALRRTDSGDPYRTDNGNFMIDCRFPDGISDPRALEERLQHRAGIVDTGLFLGMATEAIIATADGLERLTRASRFPGGAP